MYVVGSPPLSSGGLGTRADHSLPQPLHLKAVFTDHNERKASIRFEFVSISTNSLRVIISFAMK